jgi:hypothetical protein
MDSNSRYDDHADDDNAFTRRAWLVNAVSAAAIVFAVGVGSAVNGIVGARSAIKVQSPADPDRTLDAYDLIADALLAPALADASVPLRWVDPRVASQCGRYTSITVNNRELVPGAAVPDGRFDIAWYSDGCHPPGAPDVRIDGWVKLVVFREDWGFSAIIEPERLNITRGDYDYPIVKRGGASLSRCQSSERLVPTTFEEGEPMPC